MRLSLLLPLTLLAMPSLALPLSSAAETATTAQKPAYRPKIISADAARADIALLRRALETIHPGLYRYASKSQIDAAFARLEAIATGPVSELTLHREIALLLAAIHCDHTKAETSDALTAYRTANPTHLPFRFRLIEGRMIVFSTDGQPDAPPLGSEILAINGMPVAVLLLKLAPTIAYDGGTDQAIAAKLADDSDLMGDDFNENYPSLLGLPDRWAIDWKPVGDAIPHHAVLNSVSFERWTRLESPVAPYRAEFYNGVTWRMAGKVARLHIDTFVNYRNPVQPTAFLGGFFKAMKEAGTDHLILDLRNNGGGSEDVSIALGRYLLDAPFVWSKPVRYKAIRYGDLPDHIESWGDRAALFTPPESNFTRSPEGWYDRNPPIGTPEESDDISTIAHLPVADRFTGKLTILTGPRNGSGATRTIAQLKERRGAALIGEDSAGSAEGPTSGAIFLMTLPNSGVKIRIASAWNRTNIDHFVPGMGVPVDTLVVPTLADAEAGRDRALEFARTTPPPATAAMVTAALAGQWSGTLDYRDYGNDQRVTLPTLLDSDGRTLSWTFDDGPGKIVRSRESWVVDPARRTLTIRENGKAVVHKIAEFYVGGADKALTLIFDETVIENATPRFSRTILTQRGDRLRITTMTRAAGEPFLMRHSYEMRRAAK